MDDRRGQEGEKKDLKASLLHGDLPVLVHLQLQLRVPEGDAGRSGVRRHSVAGRSGVKK